MGTIPRKEIEKRIGKFQLKLKEKEIEAAIIAQNVDLFYFTGTCQKGYLIIPAEGEPLFLVNKSLKRAREESPLANVRFLQSFGNLPAALQENIPGPKRIGLELDVLPAHLYLRLQKIFPQAQLVDISMAIRKLRMLKSPYEIEIFRQGAEISRQMLQAVPRFLKAGKQEVVFAAEIECFLRSLGHQGAVRMRQFNQETFYGHIMSGENLTYPTFFDGPTGGPGLSPAYPQGPGWKKIQEDEMVLVDYLTVYQGYCVDSTRFFFLGNNVPDLLQKAHQVTLAIQDEVIKTAKPGVYCSEIYKLACQLAADSGFKDYFMGHGEDQAPFVGHGVGLELDELPFIADRQDYPLQEGMVFALEPKMIIPGLGATGVENTLLVTDQGLEKITVYPEDIILVDPC
ncbi:MAG: M24 family metallopeptidase [Dethiobacteria bacterium]|jgi:Xaa-Pro dipeptidase